MQITRAFLFAIAPGASATIVDAIIEHQAMLGKNGILTPNHVAHFFGQSACETAGFNLIEENLYYTSTARLRKVWPSRFKSDKAAAPYVRNPKALANLVYGGRLGNRAGTDDGWNYRGSGCKQTTGRFNFSVVEKETGVKCVDMPDLLRKFPSALEAACVYWRVHNLGRFADTNDVPGLTKAIQGGSGGLADRQIFTSRALKFIRAGVPSVTVQTSEKASWLRKGTTDTIAVRELQHALQAAGYYKGGTLDGDFGDGTELAVREFQRDTNLIVDGIVGEKTLSAILARAVVPKEPSPEPVTPSQSDNHGAGLAWLLWAVLEAIKLLFRKKG